MTATQMGNFNLQRSVRARLAGRDGTEEGKWASRGTESPEGGGGGGGGGVGGVGGGDAAVL